MLMDYHLHSTFSPDGESTIEQICQVARQKGLSHIAITDHHDLGYPKFKMKDIDSYVEEIDRCKSLFPDLSIARGMELDYRPETWEQTKGIPRQYSLDFALLSLHFIDGVDPYLPEYFEGRTHKEGYSLYLNRLAEMISVTEGHWVLGHIAYVSKFAQFENPQLRYCDYPEELDEVLRLTVSKGYGLEVNSSGIKNKAGLLPGSDVLKRFRELGGEIVTIGSDAHEAKNVGRWGAEALAAVQEAGFRYLAVYKDLQPTFTFININ